MKRGIFGHKYIISETDNTSVSDNLHSVITAFFFHICCIYMIKLDKVKILEDN